MYTKSWLAASKEERLPYMVGAVYIRAERKIRLQNLYLENFVCAPQKTTVFCSLHVWKINAYLAGVVVCLD